MEEPLPVAAADGTVVVRELSDERCRTLLAGCEVGRLCFVVDGFPIALPVNYAYRNGRIWIQTGAGDKLEHAPLTAVGFEIDDIQPATRTGWSVLARGVARWATAEDRAETASSQVPEPWIPGPFPALLVVRVKYLSGRSIDRE